LRLPLIATLIGGALAAMFLLALAETVAAQNVASDIPLAGGGSERVVITIGQTLPQS